MSLYAIRPAVAVAAVSCSIGGPTALAAECTCRAGGRDYEVGRTVCLAVPEGHRLAICGMVMNNTSWRFSDTPCVGARRQPGQQGVTALPGPNPASPGG